MTPAPLLDLLGAAWDLGAPVAGLAWSAEGSRIGYLLGNGRLALADTRWPRGPRIEPRPGGGVAMFPAEAPAPRPVQAACHQGGGLVVAADAAGGFLTGGDDGRVVHVPAAPPEAGPTEDGEPRVLARVPDTWIAALACSMTGVHAHAAGRQLLRTRRGSEAPDAIELPAPATALAFSPDGRCLAAAHHGGVTLWPDDALPRQLAWPGYHRTLAWSPDGRYLVTGLQENGLHGWRVADGGHIEMGGYPLQPRSLSFSHDGRWLATSGHQRPVCWRFDPPGADDGPAECGVAGRTPVTHVACHPKRPLIAAGHHDGALLLCQPGRPAVLPIKGPGGGAVNALAWSGDGMRLAFGTQGGLFGWLALPAAMFQHPEETLP